MSITSIGNLGTFTRFKAERGGTLERALKASGQLFRRLDDAPELPSESDECFCGVAHEGRLGQAYNEEAFRFFLEVERKRAERSNREVLLLLVNLTTSERETSHIGPATASRLFTGLRQCLRETDFVGWLREGHMAAAVLTQPANVNHAESAGQLAARIQSVVREGLPAGIARRLQVRVSAAAETSGTNAGPAWPAGVRPCGHPIERPHVVSAELFRDVVIREHKRVERSNQPSVLLLMKSEGPAAGSPDQWKAVLQSLSAVKRETDIFGWIEPHATLGVILPEIKGLETDFALTFEDRLRRDLEKRLGAEAARSFSIRFHGHPGLARRTGASGGRVDSLPPTLASREPRTKIHHALKRAVDLTTSLALVVALSPLLALIALLVKLRSPGPVFFRQERIGEQGRPFTIFKFRTMRADADDAIHRQFVTEFIRAGGQGDRVEEPGRSGLFKITNDPRITPLGHVLRKTSLDELPQLWNVVKGEMSLVGPRPVLAYEAEQYELWHHGRTLTAKPGITGLWQVTGRSRTTFDEMVRLDIRYAREHSLWADIKILLATPKVVIAGKGAC